MPEVSNLKIKSIWLVGEIRVRVRVSRVNHEGWKVFGRERSFGPTFFLFDPCFYFLLFFLDKTRANRHGDQTGHPFLVGRLRVCSAFFPLPTTDRP